MHKTFYASGFLYHSPSQQILLQQHSSGDQVGPWTLFGGSHTQKDTVEEAFKRIIFTVLGVKLPHKAIFPVYAYLHDTMGEYSITYAEIGRLKKFPPLKGTVFGWFTRKQINKIRLEEQTKQDIVVGFRVIDAKERKDNGLQTLE